MTTLPSSGAGTGGAPSLVTEPPLAPQRFALHGAQMRIGRTVESAIRLDHPLVDARHALLLEREDGWWITAPAGRVRINDAILLGDHRLRDGDRITLGDGAVLRYDAGGNATGDASSAGGRAAGTATAPATGRVESRAGRKRRRWRMPRITMPSMSMRGIAPWIAVLAIGVLAGGFGWYAWRTWGATAPVAPDAPPLTVQQATQFDSLLTVAYDHIERGQTLVEYGVNQAALDEFATGIAAITTSSLRNVPYVRERVEALRASVADIYRLRNLSVPGTYASAKRTVSLATSGLRAALSVEQFAEAFAAVQAAFNARYHTELHVTGADHPEHLSLYGAGGALDLRSSTLRAEQVQFVVETAQQQGIRVKDFSQDAVLRAQIAAAIKAGLKDRAGTGLHLHIDRFANRRDRYTVP